MIQENESLPVGYCQHCRVECGKRIGSDIWPERIDLADKVVWECPMCAARVGTHEQGKLKGKALGTAANPELRKARQFVHTRLDPLWQGAHNLYPDAKRHDDQGERRKALAIIKRTARKRVYEFLADGMGMEFDRCHTAMFDIDQCRQAWRLLDGVSYEIIRDWAKAVRAIISESE